MNYLPLNPTPEVLLNKLKYWEPNVDIDYSKKHINSNLKIATVISETLFNCLKYECDIILLTPQNWKSSLKRLKPDLVLFESTWQTASGHWYLAQPKLNNEHDELLSILNYANLKGIPTVYWITKDVSHLYQYINFATNFKYVFCADHKAINELSHSSISADLLEPCVQPALYNPLCSFYENTLDEIDTCLFDGWADFERYFDDLEILNKIVPFGLSIIESRFQIFKNKISQFKKFEPYFLGCVTSNAKAIACKYAKTYLSFEKSISNDTTKVWRHLEAAASRMSILHKGILSEGHPLKGIILERPDEDGFLTELIRFSEDELYWERIAHHHWRNIHEKHTYSHRIKTITDTIGIANDWVEYPKISMIMPSNKREFIARGIENCLNQNYPNKEIIVVYNDIEIKEDIDEKLISDQRFTFLKIPNDKFAGACLDYGVFSSSGGYCFRIDDDDYYGTNYVKDSMYYLRSVDAKLIGKPPVPLYLKNKKKILIRNLNASLSIIPLETLLIGTIWPGGNTIAAKTEFLKTYPYTDKSCGAADSLFILNLPEDSNDTCVLTDRFNVVAERRDEGEGHTWKLSNKSLMHFDDMNCTIDDLMI